MNSLVGTTMYDDNESTSSSLSMEATLSINDKDNVVEGENRQKQLFEKEAQLALSKLSHQTLIKNDRKIPFECHSNTSRKSY